MACTSAPTICRSNKESLEDCMCSICLCILIHPVTLPCGHELCMPCFKQTVEEASLSCPMCRTRISTWTRRASKAKTLVDQKRWEQIQRLFPDKVQRRLSGLDDETDEEVEEREDIDVCYRRMVQLSQPGEIRQEYEAELKRLNQQQREEREQEEAASAALIRRLRSWEEEEAASARQRQLDIAAQDAELAQKLERVGEEAETESPIQRLLQESRDNYPNQLPPPSTPILTLSARDSAEKARPASVNKNKTLETFFRRLPPGGRTAARCSSEPKTGVVEKVTSGSVLSGRPGSAPLTDKENLPQLSGGGRPRLVCEEIDVNSIGETRKRREIARSRELEVEVDIGETYLRDRPTERAYHRDGEAGRDSDKNGARDRDWEANTSRRDSDRDSAYSRDKDGEADRESDRSRARDRDWEANSDRDSSYNRDREADRESDRSRARNRDWEANSDRDSAYNRERGIDWGADSDRDSDRGHRTYSTDAAIREEVEIGETYVKADIVVTARRAAPASAATAAHQGTSTNPVGNQTSRGEAEARTAAVGEKEDSCFKPILSCPTTPPRAASGCIPLEPCVVRLTPRILFSTSSFSTSAFPVVTRFDSSVTTAATTATAATAAGVSHPGMGSIKSRLWGDREEEEEEVTPASHKAVGVKARCPQNGGPASSTFNSALKRGPTNSDSALKRDPAIFDGARNRGPTSFSSAGTRVPVSFDSARNGGPTSFSCALTGVPASFSNARIRGPASVDSFERRARSTSPPACGAEVPTRARLGSLDDASKSPYSRSPLKRSRSPVAGGRLFEGKVPIPSELKGGRTTVKTLKVVSGGTRGRGDLGGVLERGRALNDTVGTARLENGHEQSKDTEVVMTVPDTSPGIRMVSPVSFERHRSTDTDVVMTVSDTSQGIGMVSPVSFERRRSNDTDVVMTVSDTSQGIGMVSPASVESRRSVSPRSSSRLASPVWPVSSTSATTVLPSSSTSSLSSTSKPLGIFNPATVPQWTEGLYCDVVKLKGKGKRLVKKSAAGFLSERNSPKMSSKIGGRNSPKKSKDTELESEVRILERPRMLGRGDGVEKGVSAKTVADCVEPVVGAKSVVDCVEPVVGANGVGQHLTPVKLKNGSRSGAGRNANPGRKDRAQATISERRAADSVKKLDCDSPDRAVKSVSNFTAFSGKEVESQEGKGVPRGAKKRSPRKTSRDKKPRDKKSVETAGEDLSNDGCNGDGLSDSSVQNRASSGAVKSASDKRIDKKKRLLKSAAGESTKAGAGTGRTLSKKTRKASPQRSIKDWLSPQPAAPAKPHQTNHPPPPARATAARTKVVRVRAKVGSTTTVISTSQSEASDVSSSSSASSSASSSPANSPAKPGVRARRPRGRKADPKHDAVVLATRLLQSLQESSTGEGSVVPTSPSSLSPPFPSSSSPVKFLDSSPESTPLKRQKRKQPDSDTPSKDSETKKMRKAFPGKKAVGEYPDTPTKDGNLSGAKIRKTSPCKNEVVRDPDTPAKDSKSKTKMRNASLSNNAVGEGIDTPTKDSKARSRKISPCENTVGENLDTPTKVSKARSRKASPCKNTVGDNLDTPTKVSKARSRKASPCKNTVGENLDTPTKVSKARSRKASPCKNAVDTPTKTNKTNLRKTSLSTSTSSTGKNEIGEDPDTPTKNNSKAKMRKVSPRKNKVGEDPDTPTKNNSKAKMRKVSPSKNTVGEDDPDTPTKDSNKTKMRKVSPTKSEAGDEFLSSEDEEGLSQEEKDMRMALRLQRQFDLADKHKLNIVRFKGTNDQYSLRRAGHDD